MSHSTGSDMQGLTESLIVSRYNTEKRKTNIKTWGKEEKRKMIHMPSNSLTHGVIVLYNAPDTKNDTGGLK